MSIILSVFAFMCKADTAACLLFCDVKCFADTSSPPQAILKTLELSKHLFAYLDLNFLRALHDYVCRQLPMNLQSNASGNEYLNNWLLILVGECFHSWFLKSCLYHNQASFTLPVLSKFQHNDYKQDHLICWGTITTH